MAKTNIVIDLSQLQRTINQYDNIISEFEKSVKETENAINFLKRSGWKSAASTAYFKHYEDTWKNNMKKKIKILKHVKKCLEKAQTEYTKVYNEALKLKKAI